MGQYLLPVRSVIVIQFLLAAAVMAQQPSLQTEPLSLAAATSAAFQQVNSLQQAQIDEAIAVEDLKQARAAMLPRARSASSITYNSPAKPPLPVNTPSFLASNAIHEYQELLGVTGDLNFGTVAAVRRARALLQAARSGTEIARRALTRAVAEGYYGAAVATAQRRAAEESLAAAEEFERVTELNYNAGEVPEVDFIRARLLTAQRRDDLSRAVEAEVIANASLGTLLGRINTPPAIEPLPQTVDAAGIEALASDSVSRRPEFAQLEAQVQAARHGIGIARAGILPRVTYSLDRGFDSPSLARREFRQYTGTLAIANIEIPIFEWGAARSRTRQAQLRAKGAELQRQLTIRDLRLQFATARQRTLTAAARVDSARRALADAERNVTISIARYREGEAPITEATDSQTTLAQQRLTLQQALFDYQVARAHLREAAGE